MIPTTKSLLIVAAVAVGILMSGCDPTCTMYVHADRIMAGQVKLAGEGLRCLAHVLSTETIEQPVVLKGVDRSREVQ